jgi:hypothetical protein
VQLNCTYDKERLSHIRYRGDGNFTIYTLSPLYFSRGRERGELCRERADEGSQESDTRYLTHRGGTRHQSERRSFIYYLELLTMR